jgi:hypothetical protein
MSGFLDSFPRINYDINRSGRTEYQSITNILFRVNFIREVLNDASSYFLYDVTDSDTLEILAEKVYKNPDAYWMITYANDIYDPQYDWPLNYIDFNNYIEGKYGSIANAKTTFHHYEKVIERNYAGNVTVFRYQINEAPISEFDLPANAKYTSYETLADGQEVVTINTSDGKTIIETTYRNRVSNYDYEEELNNSKRSIKVIKREFYPKTQQELNTILNVNAGITYLRKLV